MTPPTTTEAIRRACRGTGYKPFLFRRLIADGPTILVVVERDVFTKPPPKEPYATVEFREDTGTLTAPEYYSTQHPAIAAVNERCAKAQKEEAR